MSVSLTLPGLLVEAELLLLGAPSVLEETGLLSLLNGKPQKAQCSILEGDLAPGSFPT